MDEEFLKLIRTRERHGGIQLASDYVSTIWSCLGDDRCAQKWGDLDGAKLEAACKEAESCVVYQTDSMKVLGGTHRLDPGEPKLFGTRKRIGKSTPKACMDFECVLTATVKDRDGDVLESEGAELDPMMALLFQHIPLQPVGKFIELISQNKKDVRVHAAILDNEMGHDMAELVDFGCVRISHGFKPLAFAPLKKGKDDETFEPGWHVTRFKVLEMSLVTVPSNESAVITAFSRNKLHHPLVKGYAMALKAKEPATAVSGYVSTPQEICYTCGKTTKASHLNGPAACKCKALGDDPVSGGADVTPPVNVPAGITCKQPGCKEKPVPGSEFCEKHLKKVEEWYQKNKDLVIPIRVLERICPDCAGKAKAKGWSGIKLSAFKDGEPSNIDQLCAKLRGEEHPYTTCLDMVLDWADHEPDDPNAFCGWLTSQCGLRAHEPETKTELPDDFWQEAAAMVMAKAPSARSKNQTLIKEAHGLFGETHDHPKTGDGHKSMCKDGMAHLKAVMAKPDGDADDDDDDDDDDDGKKPTGKAGRVMSSTKLARVKSAFNLAAKMADDSDMHRPGKSMMRECRGYLKAVIVSANPGVTGEANPGAEGRTNPETNVEGKPDGKACAAWLLGHLYKGTKIDRPLIYALEEALPAARHAADEDELMALMASE